MKYRVVKITNNVKDYPNCESDTAEFPELANYVQDEMDLFVVDEEKNFWPASEFFYMKIISLQLIDGWINGLRIERRKFGGMRFQTSL